MRPGLGRDRVRAIYDRVARRYDTQHALLTAGSDGRGRRLVVASAVRDGDRVLDAGAGTGSTGLLAAQRTGPSGRVVMLDASFGMLAMARAKARTLGVAPRIAQCVGDMLALPFADASFDAVLSTYSACPLSDPAAGGLELYRTVRPGGRLGIAHSSEPRNPLVRRLARLVEALVWRFPMISLGCRPVAVLPALRTAGADVMLHRMIGIPLWPFEVSVVERP
jgi:demethylmenaquinone methyltransferase/2-methoxy-6-polyprenyl-1,4-benzoquinol methylase